jgi:thioredoxin 1
MFFAMLAGAGLLAAWMLLRGVLKMKTSNVLILIAVLAVVAGVAWFRSAREGSGAGGTTPATAPAATDPAPGTTTAPVQKGDLCPEPLPTTKALATSTSSPAAPATSQTAAGKLPRVVDLGADKCIPCKKLAPILEELKKEYAGRVVVEFIDVWKDPKAGEPYRIRVIPTQIFFDADGKEVWRHEGFLPKEDFVKKFAEVGVK